MWGSQTRNRTDMNYDFICFVTYCGAIADCDGVWSVTTADLDEVSYMCCKARRFMSRLCGGLTAFACLICAQSKTRLETASSVWMQARGSNSSLPIILRRRATFSRPETNTKRLYSSSATLPVLGCAHLVLRRPRSLDSAWAMLTLRKHACSVEVLTHQMCSSADNLTLFLMQLCVKLLDSKLEKRLILECSKQAEKVCL